MIRLSVDYGVLMRQVDRPVAASKVGSVLLDALAEGYERRYPDCSLVRFVQSGATYLFALASAVDAGREDRTVAAWAVTPLAIGKRDASYQRGFPLPPANIFRQQRALNRGWSEQRRSGPAS